MSNTSTYQQASYSIGVVARLTGISTHCLRMWERRYGLGSSKRTDGGQREYSKVDLDHLKLIKQLIDKGMRIKDIANLPQKTLSMICDKSSSTETSFKQDLKLLVIGSQFFNILTKHSNRYPQLSIEFANTTTEKWLAEADKSVTASVVILQIEKGEKISSKQISLLKRMGCSIFIHSNSFDEGTASKLNKIGAYTLTDLIDLKLIDNIIEKAKKEQTYTSVLFDSSKHYDIPLPGNIPHYFDNDALAIAAQKNNALSCQCPSHITAIIQSLNAFEQYSQQCQADNWKEAATHACIYAYTAQARNFMEKALLAAIDED